MPANILIVDDEESIRSIFTTVLEREGYNVVTAADGHEAIEKIESLPVFDLVVVDINIPGPDGIEILKYVKNTSEDTGVIVVSGYASLDTAIEAVRQDACDYIVKPLDIQTISDAIRRGVEKQRQAAEAKQLLAQLEQRTFELSALYELRDAIDYTLDYREFVEPVMNSLRKIIDHDVSAFLFITGEDRGELTVWVNHGTPVGVIGQVKSSLVDAFNLVAANSISEDIIFIYVNETDESTSQKDLYSELRSFINVALVIRDEGEDRLAGMVNISSYKEDAFDPGTSKLFHDIASNISNALEKLARVLAGEKSKLEMMVRSMTDGVIMFDQRGHMTVLNPAARRMLGLKEVIDAGRLAEHIGNTRLSGVFDRIWDRRDALPYVASASGEDIAEVVLEEDGFEEEIPIEKTGKFVSANVSPIKGDDGRTYGIVAVLRDITRRKEIDEAKSVFVSSVSHELRTPLTAIKNAVSIIEMAGEVNHEQRKFLSISVRNIDRLERLINRILDFSKLEDGKLEMDFDFVDLRTLARESVNAIKNLAAGKSIEIIEDIPDDLPRIYADYHRLDQVFTNILDNAIKYTPANGQVTIEARSVDFPSINGRSIPIPQFIPTPGFVEVSISDTGIGISPEDQERIFDRFEQISVSYKTGVGLGLSIVKKIIERHYGEIWVESKVGKGSKFMFILPVDRKCNRIINLSRTVDREIETAKADRSPFSLILTQIEGFAEHGDVAADETVATITRCIQHNAGIKETMICRSEDYGFVFSLYEGDKDAAANVERRISELVQKLPGNGPIERVDVKTRIATYPDDGASAAELMDALAQNCSSRGIGDFPHMPQSTNSRF
jgi:two-component system phosphate regulon sensor histidine kinase PhoR